MAKRTLQEHRDFVLEWTDRNDIAACIAQVQHAMQVSVEALVRPETEDAMYERMQHELSLEQEILRELEERVSNENRAIQQQGQRDDPSVEDQAHIGAA